VGAVRLDCPLCGARVSDGDEPEAGRCPQCGARYVGGTDRPQGAAEAALALHGGTGDPDRVARGLFDLDVRDGVALTSDQRDGFYAWWVFVADDPAAAARLLSLAE
jgi:hypothetical protein